MLGTASCLQGDLPWVPLQMSLCLRVVVFLEAIVKIGGSFFIGASLEIVLKRALQI